MPEPRKSSPAAKSADDTSDLVRLREDIDGVDTSILAALNERARLVQQVGRVKSSRGDAVYVAAREQEIVDRLVAANDGPFPNEGLAPVFREIVSATRSLEEVLRVAYFGPEGTFTHLAASRMFGQLADLTSHGSIAEVFTDVTRGRASLGVVPIENTSEGVVTETYDAFAETELSICGESLVRVSYRLLSRSGRIEDVRRVATHPQSLAQCRLWLDRNLPSVERVAAASTAAAARQAAADGSVAAIGSEIAAEVYGLEIIESGIEDRGDNTTRFVLIGKQEPSPGDNDMTSAVFTIRRDESGGLYRLLEPFAERGINLTSIQLRPMRGKLWEYLFFLDFEGHRNESRVAEAMDAAAKIAHSYRILGSFPRASRRAI